MGVVIFALNIDIKEYFRKVAQQAMTVPVVPSYFSFFILQITIIINWRQKFQGGEFSRNTLFKKVTNCMEKSKFRHLVGSLMCELLSPLGNTGIAVSVLRKTRFWPGKEENIFHACLLNCYTCILELHKRKLSLCQISVFLWQFSTFQQKNL